MVHKQQESLHNKKILVTGANGFIGSNLVRYLNWVLGPSESHYFLFLIGGRRSPKRMYPLLGCNYREYHEYEDLLEDPSQIGKIMHRIQPDIVIHLGADPRTGIPEDGDAQYRKNEKFALDLFWAFKNERRDIGQRSVFINASSAAVYGNNFNEDLMINIEEDHPNPLSTYAHYKRRVEQGLFDILKMGGQTPAQRNNSPLIFNLRLFNVFGQGELYKYIENKGSSYVGSAVGRFISKLEGAMKVSSGEPCMLHPSYAPLYKKLTSFHKPGVEYMDALPRICTAPPIWSPERMARDWIYINDVVGYITMFASTISSPLSFIQDTLEQTIYNVGSGKAMRWVDMAEGIREEIQDAIVQYADALGITIEKKKYPSAQQGRHPIGHNMTKALERLMSQYVTYEHDDKEGRRIPALLDKQGSAINWNTYQYYTRADMMKTNGLKSKMGHDFSLTPFQQGVWETLRFTLNDFGNPLGKSYDRK